ncbi:MAG: hypothetical protein IH901_02560 [Proteobacteria bacterium]|nr:hypothetical protein [Pseudomonadota bacterium]
MIKIFLTFVFIISSYQPFISLAEDQSNEEIAWVRAGFSLLGDNEDVAEYFTLFETSVCRYDKTENLLCFDFGWRNSCLEVYAGFFLSDEIPYIFSKDEVPVLQVDNYNKIDLKKITELEDLTGPILPRSYTVNYLLWRVEAGSTKTLLESEQGIIYHLLNGEKITVFFTLQNGTIMRSIMKLKGIKPLIETALENAKAAKPSNQVCSG